MATNPPGPYTFVIECVAGHRVEKTVANLRAALALPRSPAASACSATADGSAERCGVAISAINVKDDEQCLDAADRDTGEPVP